jgi:hypothetical protein
MEVMAPVAATDWATVAKVVSIIPVRLRPVRSSMSRATVGFGSGGP